jgi:hypothetical protein
MFNQTFFSYGEHHRMRNHHDSVDARLRSIFTPNVRFVEVVEDGFAGGNFRQPPNEPGRGDARRSSTSSAPASKASIVGRLVAKDFFRRWSGVDRAEDAEHGVKLDYNNISLSSMQFAPKYENEHTPRLRSSASPSGRHYRARSVIWFS